MIYGSLQEAPREGRGFLQAFLLGMEIGVCKLPDFQLLVGPVGRGSAPGHHLYFVPAFATGLD